MSPDGRRWSAAVALLILVGALLAWSAPPWPDDWDGIGFLASITRFDLAKFAPHPPGYPVYVVLLRVASWFTASAVAAAGAVAVGSGVTTLAALGVATRRWLSVSGAPAGAAWAVALAVIVCPAVWHASSVVGSEGPALAFGALAACGLTRRDARGAAFAGVMVGLGLGVRASWAPFLLPMMFLAPRRVRARGWACVAAGALAWAIPLVMVVGPRQLLALSQAHVVGHAGRWGGTVLTEPSRLPYLARDVFVDGLGVGGDALGVAIAAATMVVGGYGALAWRRASWRGAGAAALVLGPYLLWILLGQNLRGQPRHALPIVAALGFALALPAIFDRRVWAPVVLLFALVALRTAMDAHARRTIAPPGAQLLALVRTLPSPERIAVFAGPSARFFEPTELAKQAVTVGTMGDVILALGRFSRMPARVLVTSEIEGLSESPFPIDPLTTLARPARLDRHMPTLAAYELRISSASGH